MTHNLFVPVKNADAQKAQSNCDSEDSISFGENLFVELVEPRLDVTPVACSKPTKQAVVSGSSELGDRNGLDRPGSGLNVETDMEKTHTLPTTDDKERQLTASAKVVIAQPNDDHRNGQ